MLSFEESEVALRNACVGASGSRDVIVVEGPEAASYLHGQMSQNVEGLGEGSSAWTLLLEPNGRVTAWGRLTRVGPETIWFGADEGAGPDALARLDRFKLRTKATFSPHWSVPTFSVRGPATPSSAQLQETVASNTPTGTPSIVAAPTSWPGSPGVDLIGLELDLDAGLANSVDALTALGVAIGDPAVLELERVEAGRPAMGHEFGEKTIPAETGVVDRSADFTKGCYVGQELVARIDSRGNNTPRAIHPVRLPAGQAPLVGAELMRNGEVVGAITSVAGASGHVAALASIKRGVEVPVELTVEIDGDAVGADVQTPHWL